MTSEILYLHTFILNILIKIPIPYLKYFQTYLVDRSWVPGVLVTWGTKANSHWKSDIGAKTWSAECMYLSDTLDIGTEFKGPKMGTWLMCRKNSKETSIAGVEWMRENEIGDPGWRDYERPVHVKLSYKGVGFYQDEKKSC